MYTIVSFMETFWYKYYKILNQNNKNQQSTDAYTILITLKNIMS